MKPFIRPDFYEHAYPVAVSLSYKYRGYAEVSDIRSDLIEWAYKNNESIEQWLGAEDKRELKTNIWIMNKRLYKQGERFCRRMKAQSLGYHHTDEWFFNKGIIREFLPMVLSGDWRETLLGQPEGGRSAPREPSTGNNLSAMAIDIDRAIPKLSLSQQEVLKLLYVEELPVELVALEVGISEKAVRARVDRAISRIIDLTGGESPWDGIGSRKVISNAQASVRTSTNM